MRKFVLFLIFFFCQTAYSADYFPVYVNFSVNYGKGVIAIEDAVKIYQSDSINSPVAALLGKNGLKNSVAEDTFIAAKEGGLHLLPVERDTDDWYYVCYSQSKKLFGWVKKSENIDYISWEQFFDLYGRKNGIYIFRNVPDAYKKLFSSPDAASTVVDNFNFPKYVSLWFTAGDWMLIKVTTYEGQTKTGWMRYRLENGSLLAFPDFSGQ